MPQPVTTPSNESANGTAAARTGAAAVSHVCSPAGIRLVSGLVAPYLSAAGQGELHARWDSPPADLFTDALAIAQALRTHPALHAALGVWVRNHHLPAPAAAALGHLLNDLPTDDAEARQMLDSWAATNTRDMIQSFPGEVRADTTAVLASAVAMEDTWQCATTETRVEFTGKWVAGFEASLSPWALASTVDEATVRATLHLTSGLQMAFAASCHGAEAAAELLTTPDRFTAAPKAGQPFVTVQSVEHPTEMVAFLAPEFTTRTMLDLGAEAAAWGLGAAMSDGAPGLGDLPLSGAVQDAFIEVTHSGVRAAAVTAMMFAAANMTLPRETYQQMVVSLDRPFAYAITSPSIQTPLFTGIYAG